MEACAIIVPLLIYMTEALLPVKTALLSRVPWPRTLEKALSSAKAIPQNLILHSNQGSQFTSTEFVQHCRKLGISQSMSRAGCSYDNAPMKRFYNTLKTELIYQYRFETAAELDYAVSEFAYDWYNQVRPHTYNGYLTPFEKRERSVPLSSGVTKSVDHYRPFLWKVRCMVSTLQSPLNVQSCFGECPVVAERQSAHAFHSSDCRNFFLWYTSFEP